PTATLLAKDDVILLDANELEAWFDFCVIDVVDPEKFDKSHYAVFNNREMKQGDSTVFHSNDRHRPGEGKNAAGYNFIQHIVQRPRKTGNEPQHTLFVASSYGEHITTAKRSAAVYVCSLEEKEEHALFEMMEKDLKTNGQIPPDAY